MLIHKKIQKTPRDGTEHGEGEAEAQGMGEEEHGTTTQDHQGSGPPVEVVRGEGRDVC